MKKEVNFEVIVNHIKGSGFIYQGSEIYGGLANTFDYGPLGVELKNNLKQAWWKRFVYSSPHNIGLDSAILMNKEVWKASGHLATFGDPLMDCKKCKVRYRADNLIEEIDPNINAGNLNDQELTAYIKEHEVKCPNCGADDFSDIRQFNLMFKTHQGVTEESKNEVYLRPETAQGIFVNFKNILRTTRRKLPLGVAQIGKSFRNEITPGNFIFRTREFEQMELEFFCKPGEDNYWYEYWKKEALSFLNDLGLSSNNLKLRDHDKEELSFYSVGTCDIEYKYNFGWGELWGIANRTDYDLSVHSKHSNEKLDYLDPTDNSRYTPYCVEPSLGVDRLFLAILNEAYDEEELEDGETRVVLRLKPSIAPIKACFMPLSKKLSDKTMEVYSLVAGDYNIEYDESGSIGKRYRRQDAIGTPYCITIDFDTLEDESVTVRHRDTMEQERVKITDLSNYLRERI